MRSWGWFGMGVLVLFAADTAREGHGEPAAVAAPQPMVIVEFVPAKHPLNARDPVPSAKPVLAAKVAAASATARADDDADDAGDADDEADDEADDDSTDGDSPDDTELAIDGHVGPPSERDISSRLGRMRAVLKTTKPAGGSRALTDEPDEKQATKGADDELRAIYPKGKFATGAAAETEKDKKTKNGSTLTEHESDGNLPHAATRHRPLTKFQRQ